MLRGGDGKIDARNFDEIRGVIKQISCIGEQEDDDPMPQGKKARELWLKRREGRKQKKASNKANGKDLVIPNLISAVSAKGPSYNLINIWNLTVWQLYDQFARISVNAQTNIISVRWAAYGEDEFPMDSWYKKN